MIFILYSAFLSILFTILSRLSYIYHRFSYFLLSVIFVVPLLCADVYLTYFVSTACSNANGKNLSLTGDP